MATEIVFDHLAHAAESSADLFWRYHIELGAEYLGGGLDPGFYFFQVQFPSGMKIEMLEDDPGQPEEDFLRRFLDRNGPGPHHITFKVPDIGEVLDSIEAAGYQAVGIDRSNPEWQQAFIHPKSAPGVVIQVAQTGPDRPEQDRWVPEDLPLPPPKGRNVDMTRVALVVADRDRAVALFTTVLNGTPGATGSDDVGDYQDLVWPNGAVLRIITPTDPAAIQWMGDRAGRIHHVRFDAPVASLPPGSQLLIDPNQAEELSAHAPSNDRAGHGMGTTGAEDRRGMTVWELRPENNLGLRLRFDVTGP